MAENTSTPVSGGIHYCQDNPNRVNPKAKAKVVNPGEDITNLRLPSDAGVINRNQPIAVIRDESHTEIDDVVTNVGGQGKGGAAPEPTWAERPETVNGDDSGPAFEEVIQKPPLAGVIPTQRETTTVAANSPEPQEIRQVKTAEDVQVPQVAAPAPRPPNPAAQAPAPAPAVADPGEFFQSENVILAEAARFPKLKIRKQKVVFRSETMGCIRAKVSAISIGEGVIAIGYVDDEDTVIVEPPVGDSTQPFSVEIDGKKFECVYYGHSFEMMLPGFAPDPMLLVVLIQKEG